MIHILDTDDRPNMGVKVEMNCGTYMRFFPVECKWEHGTCEKCMTVHRESNKKLTFGMYEGY